MAKKTNNDLLSEILEDLDGIIKELKKEQKETGKVRNSVFSAIFGKTDTKDTKETSTIMQALNALKTLLDAILLSRKIKKNDIEHIQSIIKSLSTTIKEIKFTKALTESFLRFTDSLEKLNRTMAYMNDNFISNILKYNKLRGRILGRHLANFYVAFFDAFQEAKVFTKLNKKSNDSLDNFVKINDSIIKILLLSSTQIYKVGLAFKKFPEDGIKNMVKFYDAVIAVSSRAALGKEDFATKVNNFDSLLKALAKAPVVKLVAMGLLLKPEMGEKIGGFFENIIKSVNKISKNEVKDAHKIINSISLMLATLSVSLLLLVIIAKNFKPLDILIGGTALLVLLGMTCGTIALLQHIAGKKTEAENQKALKESVLIAGSIAILIMTLTLSLAISVSIVKNYKGTDILIGFGVLLSITFMAGAIIKQLNKLDAPKTPGGADIKKGIIMAGVVSLLFITLTLSIDLILHIAKKTNWKQMAKGGVILTGVLLTTIVILKIAQSMTDSPMTKKGIIGIGVTVIVLYAIIFATQLFIKTAKQASKLKGEDIWKTAGIASGLIVATIGIMAGLGAIMSSPIAVLFAVGAASLAVVTLSMIAIEGAVKNFANMVILTNKELSEPKIKQARTLLIGAGKFDASKLDPNSMIGTLNDLAKAFGSIDGLKHSRRISRRLRPLFRTLGQFIKLIKLMSNLKFVVGYNPDGTPIYEAIKGTAFSDAAANLTNGFKTFINGISTLNNNDTTKKVKDLSNLLLPHKGVIGFALGGKKSNINDLMRSLGQFMDMIQNYANLKYVISYDDNGKPIYAHFTQEHFRLAANTIAIGFSSFISTLADGRGGGFLSRSNAKKVLDICDLLLPHRGIVGFLLHGKTATINDLFKSLGYFMDLVEKAVSLKFPEYDENGKVIGYKDFNNEFESAARIIATGYTTFLSTLAGKIGKHNYLYIRDIVDAFGGRRVNNMFKSIGTFMDIITKASSLKLPTEFTGKDGKTTITYTQFDAKFKAAGEAIAIGYSTFLSTLATSLQALSNEDAIKSVSNILGTKKIGRLISTISNFVNNISKILINKNIYAAVGTRLGNFIRCFVSPLTDIENIDEFPDNAEYIADGFESLSSTISLISNMYKTLYPIVSSTKDTSSFVKNFKIAINTLNSIDYEMFATKSESFKTGVNNIVNAYNSLNTIKFNMDPIANSLNNTSVAIDKFVVSMNGFMSYKNNMLRFGYKIDTKHEETIIKLENKKAKAFNRVEKNIKKAGDQMARLIALEKEWNNLANNSVTKKLAETLQEQADALRGVINDYMKAITNENGDASLYISIRPETIAQGINMVSWNYKQQTDDTYVKF